MTANNLNTEPTLKYKLQRFFISAVVTTFIFAAFALIWGIDASLSVLTGGGTILLAASLTRIAVTGMDMNHEQKVKHLWLRLGWRLLLLAVCLYAMLQAPWLRFIPLTVGLSIFFPALVVELFCQIADNKKTESSNQGMQEK